MKNEKGFTLMEVLAAVAITLFVLGSGILLFQAVSSMARNGSQRYLDDSSVKTTLNTLSKTVADSTQALYLAAHRELRLKTAGDGCKAVILEGSLLRMYRFVGSEADFRNPSVSRQSHPDQYTPELTLTEQARSIAYRYGSSRAELGSVPVADGQLLSISVTFHQTRFTASGRPDYSEITREAGTKLLLDTTNK